MTEAPVPDGRTAVAVAVPGTTVKAWTEQGAAAAFPPLRAAA